MNYNLDVVHIQLVKDAPLYSEKPITSPQDAIDLMADQLATYDREVLCCLNMQTDGKVASMNLVSMGTVNGSLCCAREIFKSSILSNAHSIIILHNHPSGRVTPSKEDICVTKKLVDSGNLLGIEVLDHLIVGGRTGKKYSFKEHDLIDGKELDRKVKQNRNLEYGL